MTNNNIKIDENFIASFLSGKTTRDEELYLLQSMVNNTALFEQIKDLTPSFDENIEEIDNLYLVNNSDLSITNISNISITNQPIQKEPDHFH